MNIKEVSEKFNINLVELENYENIGLFDDIKKVNGIGEYEDRDIEKLSKIVTLKKVGLELEEILRYMKLVEQGDLSKDERVRILNRKRQLILEDIHNKQKSIDCLDWLIYEMNGCNSKAGEKKNEKKTTLNHGMF